MFGLKMKLSTQAIMDRLLTEPLIFIPIESDVYSAQRRSVRNMDTPSLLPTSRNRCGRTFLIL